MKRDGWVIYILIGTRWQLYAVGYKDGEPFRTYGVFKSKASAESHAEIYLSRHKAVVDYIQWEEENS